MKMFVDGTEPLSMGDLLRNISALLKNAKMLYHLRNNLNKLIKLFIKNNSLN